MILAKFSLSYDRNLLLFHGTGHTIVMQYVHKTFIVQATERDWEVSLTGGTGFHWQRIQWFRSLLSDTGKLQFY